MPQTLELRGLEVNSEILDRSGENEKNACFLVSILDHFERIMIMFKRLLNTFKEVVTQLMIERMNYPYKSEWSKYPASLYFISP
ncbi:hypothetical protein EWN99_14295 [Salmonella enterica]|nr:hypothetical protein [Salmonella enterica]